MDRETELTRKRFNRAAIFYDYMDRMIDPKLRQKVIAQAKGKVLEVGVGTGKNLPFYSRDCTEVVGIDISPDMLAKARARANSITTVPVKLMEMDAQHMAFADDTFDTIISTCVFCSVPDPIKGLQEVRRVCKPGGQVILLEHVRSEKPILGKVMDILDPVIARIGPHINRRTVENVAAAGLQIVSVEDQKIKILKLIRAKPES